MSTAAAARVFAFASVRATGVAAVEADGFVEDGGGYRLRIR
jgi:hypothetical protein